MGLRIVARRESDGAINYAMEYDDAGNDEIVVPSDGIALVVSPANLDLLDEMSSTTSNCEAGDFRFIFINPNDIRMRQPSRRAAARVDAAVPGAAGTEPRTAMANDRDRPTPADLARATRTQTAPNAAHRGEVYLVGAGPGTRNS